jgi:hypothetical protein
MSAKPWTPKEVRFLRDNYRTMTAAQIGEHIDRGIHSIYYKAYSLGLTGFGRAVELLPPTPINFELPRVPKELQGLPTQTKDAIADYVRESVMEYRSQITISRGVRGNIQRITREDKYGNVLEVIAASINQGRQEPSPLADPFAALTRMGARAQV